MTIGQAAWMAVLAVLLSTRFVCLSNQQQEQKATPAQLASSETLTLCTALIVWSVDHPPEGEGAEGVSRGLWSYSAEANR